jgi:hypothetical protein
MQHDTRPLLSVRNLRTSFYQDEGTTKAVVQLLAIRNFELLVFIPGHKIHLPARRIDFLGDAGDFIGFLGGASKGIIHHSHAGSSGAQALAHQLCDHEGVGSSSILIRMVSHANIGLNDHICP